MSSHTVNFSQSAREYGLIIYSEVSIGYDVPWRVVNKLLIEAALNTPGVVDDPRPFVLSTSLSDWYPVYQVNAYIKDADRLADIYSALHQNIQLQRRGRGNYVTALHGCTRWKCVYHTSKGRSGRGRIIILHTFSIL